jgi:cyclase
MRKAIVASILFGFFAVTIDHAQNQDFSKVEMKVEKVAGTVYMLQGAGGNIGASVGDDGIVIVDDEFCPWLTRLKQP